MAGMVYCRKSVRLNGSMLPMRQQDHGQGGNKLKTERETKMKLRIIRMTMLCLAAALLTGCSIRVNWNRKEPDSAELLANRVLIAEPVAYNPEGAYTVTFRYEAGGFLQMDLSRAYVAYDPFTVQDQIDAIVGENTADIPPLPVDAQQAIDEALEADRLQKIAVISIETVDDQTLRVSFTDRDNPISGREYYFILPDAGISGSVLPEQAG